ncbi:glutaminyl-peptide cyclotransferase [Aquimarina sp. 2201CG5-10]|uniref:glutaminyl-peptide cyclotransferase n=1 Tax=Aquimarina callyspongiae TaxID=3098150 RepID=UPI002AB41CDC|nr:glutaminyl-peptide cyclotransferase [Aquimarina sp. 2201CG5-10]MDY8135340.1 glutaminyl-peptide cyclotransferase [Aquimarina sp. 2201CG5-10]
MRNLFAFIILSFTLICCGSNSDKKTKNFSLSISNKKGVCYVGETLKATIINKKNITIDSIAYTIDNVKLKTLSATEPFTEKIDTEKLGHHKIKAIVYYDNTSQETSKKVTFFNDKAPKIYNYKIINSYPHDNKAYTQGLEFVGDTLYENTGKNGKSSLRKVNYKTGEVLKQVDLDQAYFGEGITILNDKIYQLTWQSKTGFIYDLKTLKKTGSFAYNKSKEGWGLCNNGTKIFKSDGSEKIWTLDSKTLAEQDYIQVTTNKSVKSKFNELEWVDGKIYANTYQKDGIAIINPNNGAIEGVINLKGLRPKATPTGKEEDSDYVLNGIAYKADTKQLFVTGKYWDQIFEIEVIE